MTEQLDAAVEAVFDTIEAILERRKIGVAQDVGGYRVAAADLVAELESLVTTIDQMLEYDNG